MLRPLRVVRNDAEGLDAEGVFRFKFAEESVEEKKRRPKKKKKPKKPPSPPDLRDPGISTKPALAEGSNSEDPDDEAVTANDASPACQSLDDTSQEELTAEIAGLSLKDCQATDSSIQEESPGQPVELQEKSMPSTKEKKNRRKSKAKGTSLLINDGHDDDDEALLDEAIAQIRQAQADAAAVYQTRVDDTSVRFRSHRDPELSEAEARVMRFGRGRNLSAIGPPRKRREGGSWLQPSDSKTDTSTLLHSSPFTFGFS